MNAVQVKREPQADGRVFITTRALRMEETVYVEKTGDEIVNAETDLLMHGGWQPGEETKREIESYVRSGMSLDRAFWRAAQSSGYDMPADDVGREGDTKDAGYGMPVMPPDPFPDAPTYAMCGFGNSHVMLREDMQPVKIYVAPEQFNTVLACVTHIALVEAKAKEFREGKGRPA